MDILNSGRFNIDKLRELAGDKVFARGKAYYRDGNVRLLAVDGQRVLAQVEGTENYRTVVAGHGIHMGGECSCPAFYDWGFCKHMVATALAANAEGEMGGEGPVARIRSYLREKDIDTLVDMILELAERDLALFARLDMAAAVSQADEKTVAKQLGDMLDRATRVRGYLEYADVEDWADEVDLVLDTVFDLTGAGKGDLALDLAWRAIERIEKAMAKIDDSDGRCGVLLERARNIHLAAAKAVKPEPLGFARELFRAELRERYDTFHRSAVLYAEVLGEEGLLEFRRLAHEAWEKLPSRSGRARELKDDDGNLDRLEAMLDYFAERDGDVEFRIALRAKDLSSSWRYRELVNFCLSQGREADAMRWAEEGVWVFEDDRPDERLLLTTADLLAKVGREKEAATLLQRAFSKAQSFQLYEAWAKLGGPAALESAVEVLEAALVKKKPGFPFWRLPSDLLVQIFMHEKQMDKAWEVVRKWSPSSRSAMELARASESTHASEAVAIYAHRVEQLITAGGDPSYREAVELIRRMASLREETEQERYIEDIKVRFRRKRNFIKLLA